MSRIFSAQDQSLNVLSERKGRRRWRVCKERTMSELLLTGSSAATANREGGRQEKSRKTQRPPSTKLRKLSKLICKETGLTCSERISK